MALKVKVSLIGALDMLKFKNMAADREKAIQAAPAREIRADFPINNNAKALHPDALALVVKDVVDHPDAEAKSVIFAREEGGPLPYFRAGQYLSLKLMRLDELFKLGDHLSRAFHMAGAANTDRYVYHFNLPFTNHSV